MDLVLGRFFDAHGATLSPQQLDDFEALLDEADADMYAWMCGRQEQPAAFNTAVWQQIVQFWDSNPNVS